MSEHVFDSGYNSAHDWMAVGVVNPGTMVNIDEGRDIVFGTGDDLLEQKLDYIRSWTDGGVEETIGVQATSKMALLAPFQDELKYCLSESTPALEITMACGAHISFKEVKDIPDWSVLCTCGDPNHWFIRYTDDDGFIIKNRRPHPLELKKMQKNQERGFKAVTQRLSESHRRRVAGDFYVQAHNTSF